MSESAATLRTAALHMRVNHDLTEHPRGQFWHNLASWLECEAVHARGAEYRAAEAANEVRSSVTPVFSPSTQDALAVARSYLEGGRDA